MTTNFVKKYLNKTIEIINQRIDSGINIIDVKSIRKFSNIPHENRTAINFFWRSLKELERSGLIERINERNPAKFKILKKIEIKNG